MRCVVRLWHKFTLTVTVLANSVHSCTSLVVATLGVAESVLGGQ